ncbi:hypothetical protein [Candidatus Nitrosocosmicus hydrocola]|uniref:hypothetical protein n=1 Tax=Candidatus Nitrosocosmicus hydrocola TaxID=1826872 RepID=UPI0011E5CE68|nr:hypothetical protein [Candidatus Nitrosocosmicus hydrocola]
MQTNTLISNPNNQILIYMPCNDCCQEGGVNFDFPHVDLSTVSSLQFIVPGENNMICVSYVKDGALYFSYSFDCGATFNPPQEQMSIAGSITPMQFMAKGEHMVMAFIETIGDKRYKRAIAGQINPTQSSVALRVCEASNPPNRSESSESIVSSVSVTVCEPPLGGMKSYDHVFLINIDGSVTHTCQGHG